MIRLLVLCVLAIGVGVLLLIGALVVARELFSESIFGVPHEPSEDTGSGHVDDAQSTSSSSAPIGWQSRL